jgi:hypothetical protein
MNSLSTRAALVWLLLVIAEIAHGTVRALWLAPLVGDFRSRQIGVFTGSCLILLLVWSTQRWIGFRSQRQRIATGIAWMLAMLSFELGAGHYAFGRPWPHLLADFDPTQGGFLALGMLVLAMAPWIAGYAVRSSPSKAR